MVRRALAPALPFLAFLAASPALGFDVVDLVREAAERQRDRELSSSPVGFERVEVETDLSSSKGPERRRFAIVARGATPVARELLEVDGRPATAQEKEEVRRQDEKQRRRALARGSEASDEDELRSGRLPLFDLLDRLDFQLAGLEAIDGRPSYVVEFRPRAGLVSKTMRDRVLNNFAGVVWIDAAEREVRRIDGRLTKPLKVLGGAALDVKEVRIVYEAHEAGPDLWAPCRQEIRIDAKAGMLLAFRREIRFELSGYRNEGPSGVLQASR